MQLNSEIIRSFKTNGPLHTEERVLGLKPTGRWF